MSAFPGPKSWGARFGQAALWAGITLLLTAVITVLLWRWRNVPFYWDAVGYVYPHTREIYDRGLDPILRRYDVGHPPLYYFLSAAMWKLVGPGPFGSHLVTWFFSALLMVGAFLNGKALGLRRDGAVAATVVLFTFPMVFSSHLQMQLDHPMTACHLAVIYCWATRRWIYYLLFGTAACLMKLYGFLYIPALLAAALLRSGGFWKSGNRWPFLRDTVLTCAPALAYAAFIGVAYWQRGPGLTVNHVSGNTLVPFWGDWEAYSRNIDIAWNVLFKLPMLDGLLAIVGALLLALTVVLWRSSARRAAAVDALGPVGWRVLLGLILVPFVLNGAFFQLTGLCSRYNLLLVASLVLIGFAALWQLAPRRWVLWPVVLLAIGLNYVLWHPDNAERLPEAVRPYVQREPIRWSSMYEIDLRFLDVVRLARWIPNLYWSRVMGDPSNALFITHWPLSVSYYHAAIGYDGREVPSRNARTWDDVQAIMAEPQYAAMPAFYVFTIQPIGDLLDEEGGRALGFELIRTRSHGEATAQVYRWERKGAPTP